MLTFIADIIAPIFYKLLYMSITALVIGMIVILIRRFADKRFSPFWKYAMWGIVLVALIMPWRPQSNLAVMNTTEMIQQVSFREEYVVAQTEYNEAQYVREQAELEVSLREEPLDENLLQPIYNNLTEAKAKADSLHIKTLIFDNILPALWLFGAAIIGLFMLFSGLRLGRKIKSSIIIPETDRYENALQSCKNKLGINRRVRLVMQGYVKTPALFGLFRPQIILPDYAENLSDEHLEYVILHELSHLKRGDGIINTLLLALQTVYWFNPLTWFLFKFIREDMELANDAAVLKGMDVERQKEYSLSLVEVLAEYSKPTLAPRLLCMVDSEKNMTRRINMIKLGEFFKRRKLIIAVSGLLVIAITATLFLTVGTIDAEKYQIKVTNDIIEKVDQISQGQYHSAIQDDNSFLITASKIHGAYKQGSIVRVFVTTYYSAYVIGANIVTETSAGIVPAAITYESDPDKDIYERAYLDYTTAEDGSHFTPSIESFCKLPDGQKIKGLASKIINSYGDNKELNDSHQQKLDNYLESNNLSSYLIQNSAAVTGVDKRSPGVKVTIDDWFGDSDTAEELIFEDTHYKYSLSSIRSDKIMLTFEDGKKLSLKDAISQKKISIDDLILNGLNLWMKPKNNPLGGYFNIPSHLHVFFVGEFEVFPSNAFMYSTEDSGFNSYFAADELSGYLTTNGEDEKAKTILGLSRYLAIEGIRYISQNELESVGITVNVGWVYSSHTPVWFSFADSSDLPPSLPDIKSGDAEMFLTAAKISSDRFLQVKKNMTMQQVMDTLGKTSHIIGQGPSAMYYYVDDKPLKIDFANLSDPYPFSGQEMKQYFDVYGAVNFKTIFIKDVTQLKKGMKIEDVVKTLGNTIDIGSGRYIYKYSVWNGLALTEFSFNSGGGILPYPGEEIYSLIEKSKIEVSW